MPDVSQVPCDVTFRLEPGDIMTLYSDGILEARAPETGEMFGQSRLAETIESLAQAPPSRICHEVLGAVERFSPERADDTTVVVVRLA
jgi:sigma-B regulation protein RsbU (phosphoserine phosphatase)